MFIGHCCSGSTMEQATKDVIDVQIPHISKLMQSGDIIVDSIDVFCEKGVFDLDCTQQILLAGKAINLPANFHGDELHPMNAAEVCLYMCRQDSRVVRALAW